MAIFEFQQPKPAQPPPGASTVRISRGVKAHEDAFVVNPAVREIKSVENMPELASKAYERISLTTLIRRLEFRYDQKFCPERSLLVWGIPFKTQIVPAKIPTRLSAKCHLKDIDAVIFNVKISRNIVLEYTFVPKVTYGIEDEYLLRKLRLIRAKDWNKMEEKGYSYLSIDQCPHSFSPEMVEHCEVHHSTIGWTIITDATVIYNLLENCAQMLHRLGEMPRHLCRCNAVFSSQNDMAMYEPQYFQDNFPRSNFARTTKEKVLIASGELGAVHGDLAKNETPSRKQTVDSWLKDVRKWSTYHEYFDETEQWATKPAMKYRNEEFEEPTSIDWEFYLADALKHNPTTGYQRYFLGNRPKRSTAPKPKPRHPTIMVSEPSADPTVLIIGAKSTNQTKPMVRKIRFSEAAMLWLNPRASKVLTSRYVPRNLNNLSPGMHLLTQYNLMDPKMTSEHALESNLTIYLGPLASPVCQQFDRLLKSEFQRQVLMEMDCKMVFKCSKEIGQADSVAPAFNDSYESWSSFRGY